LILENMMSGADMLGTSANRSLLHCAKVLEAPFAPRDFTMRPMATRLYRVVVNHQRREISTLFEGKSDARVQWGKK
jgi:hypothetical protein